MNDQLDSDAFWQGHKFPPFYGGDEPEVADDLSRAAVLLTQYLVPKGGGSDPTAEHVGVSLSLAAGRPADAFDVGRMDVVEAELERLAWSWETDGRSE